MSRKSPPANTQRGTFIYKLLFPVVPDVLDIVIIFHDVDELLHQLDVLLALQLLIVLGNHFDLCGNESVLSVKLILPML